MRGGVTRAAPPAEAQGIVPSLVLEGVLWESGARSELNKETTIEAIYFFFGALLSKDMLLPQRLADRVVHGMYLILTSLLPRAPFLKLAASVSCL